ncbi:MAG: patatin-like phospholipase family protein, partial [Luteibaculum sp.]
MSFAKSVASLILFIFFGSGLWAQPKGVAVVLSGGGASAYAHIGFLKALEENNIPIDYIAGASMGAIIGGLYASGFSPDEIEQILGSQAFLEEINGLSTAEVSYFFKKPDQDASWVHLKFRGDGQLQKNLPTHLIDPLFLDYELL